MVDMAKKKERIKVELNLPRDDRTESNYVTLLLFGIFLGGLILTFWLGNSFLTAPNGNPLIINRLCRFESDLQPLWEDAQRCVFTRDEASPESWSDSWSFFTGAQRSFEVPGADNIIGSHPPQSISLTCEASNARAMEITLTLLEPASPQPRVLQERVITITSAGSGEDCWLFADNIYPRDGYIFRVIPNADDDIDLFDFTLTVNAFDGVPEMMNNASMFIGPEVSMGGLSIRPFIFLNWFAVGLFVVLFPASWYREHHRKKIQAVEEKFPDFLRDLAEYWKGGLSMTLSIRTLANFEYGSLNEEIGKMADQISWGIAFQDVLNMLAERVNTPLVKRAVSLINESNKAGGKISDILLTAANDTREIKFLEGERRRAISSYIAIIWTSFMVFLGVIVVLSKVFIPAIAASNGSSGQGSGIGNMQIRAIDPLFFLTVFFYGVCAQAVGNGAVAGLMATGRFTAGFKHAGWMLLVALLLFNFVAFSPDLIGVPQPRGLNPSLGDITGG